MAPNIKTGIYASKDTIYKKHTLNREINTRCMYMQTGCIFIQKNWGLPLLSKETDSAFDGL
jgi:hypothetical protein